ncbi:MAG: S8 family serine peptidase [Microbacteriaceae bacterium]|nr:S8 family serine peptidase [Microbacteriaceae bacterium]
MATPVVADSIRGSEYWLDQYGIRAAWNVTKGAGVTIAIIDTGIDSSHVDLQGAVVGGTDESGIGASDGQAPVGDSGEHGTMVASLAAGRGHGSNSGVIGAAPEASLLSVSIAFDAGARNSDDQIADGVRWAVDHGAKVINMSLTRNSLDWPESWDNAFLYAFEHDVVVVAAAGNRGSGTTEVGAPATIPGVLVVGGVNRRGTASWNASSQGITITVCAPSEDLVGAAPGGGYYSWAGTSGATPIVAGIVALVRAAHPEMDAGNVINRIRATARNPGVETPSAIYGYGLVDAAAAVSADVSTVDFNPTQELKEWIKVHRRAEATAQPSPIGSEAPTNTRSPTPQVQRNNSFGLALPTISELRNIGVPIAVFTIFGVALIVWVWSFLRWKIRQRGR